MALLSGVFLSLCPPPPAFPLGLVPPTEAMVGSVTLAQLDRWSDSFPLPADLKAADTPERPP